MNRLRWIDIAKGLGISLVVLAHSRWGSTGYVGHWITAFHMPLFFILAGLCFDESRYPSLVAYARRKGIALLYPYVTLSLLAVLVSLCFNYGDECCPSSMLSELTHRPFINIAPLWFVQVLLIIELGYASLAKMTDKITVRLGLGIIFPLLGFRLHGLGVWPLDVACVAMVFYVIGHVMREVVNSVRLVAWVGFVLLVFYSVLIALIPYSSSMAILDIPNKVAYFPMAVLGSFAIAFLSRVIDGFSTVLDQIINFIAWLGKNSIVILVMHPMLGICRKSWLTMGMNGVLAQLAEILLLGLICYLLSGPLKILVRPSWKKRGA